MQYRTIRLGAFVLAALALASCGKQDAAQQQAGAQAVEVGVVEVAMRKVVMTSELPGRTNPYQVAEVRPQVGGIILQRLFKEGADVRRGDTLYQIDPATYQATYNSAVATQAKAEATLASAKSRAERYADLVKINAVSKQEFDDADAAHKQAVADVESAKAAVENARINLAYTKVTAPISGRIGKSDFTPGALVTASQPVALTKIQQLDPIYVDVTQSSVEWLRLKREIETGILKTDNKKQAKAKLKLEDGQMYPHEGKLEFSDVTVDQATGMITLRAVFPNPKHDLLPGMYVRAVLEEGVNEQAITIPQTAVSRDQKGAPLVTVVTPDNKIERRNIAVDREIGNEWLVSSGVKVGEKLVVEGIQRLTMPGITVNPVPAGQMKSATEKPKAAAGDEKNDARADVKPAAKK
ncbi:MAG: efflux RND transporter periplasmic adaptor subunit [Burkholderiales bacterium]|jgi:membrane fusion protein (multidrug efflux system)|nr:efflux RND transporter periplasmic adaptor subunit [Burkholderiales bacterium]